MPYEPARRLLSFWLMNPGFASEEDPGLDGPDYVALVIEWDDDDEITTVAAAPHRQTTMQTRARPGLRRP